MPEQTEGVHTLESDRFLQYIYIELVKVHVALTGELPESLKNYSDHLRDGE